MVAGCSHSGMHLRVLLLACLVVPTPGHMKQDSSNKVLEMKTSCDKESLNIEFHLSKPFKGVVFSKDFSRECRAQGNFQNSVTLKLPSNTCGVRTSLQNGTEANGKKERDLYYTVELIVQMDRQLQQSTDQQVLVKCKLESRAVQINSVALEGVVNTKIREMNSQETKKTRTGRNRQGMGRVESEQRERILEATRAWMELTPAAQTTEPATVEVGQPTRLLIRCALPVGIGLRVTNCIAHDGLGEASQKLLDDAGCPIDESIFNAPSVYRRRGIEIDISELAPIDPERNYEEKNVRLARNSSDNMTIRKMMAHQHAETVFAAFKFPDRAKLHLTCRLELCKSECPPIDCQALKKPIQSKEGLLRKSRLDKESKGNVIDRLEVYNSIEVLAPNIELEDEASIRGSRRIEANDGDIIRGFSPGDKTICLSPGKMALAFCVLGVIFLCAIAVAFVSLIRARRRMGREPLHTSLSFYTGSKSLFSSSESSTSGLSGSKLLLTDSPYMDHHSSSSNNWPYSRSY